MCKCVDDPNGSSCTTTDGQPGECQGGSCVSLGSTDCTDAGGNCYSSISACANNCPGDYSWEAADECTDGKNCCICSSECGNGLLEGTEQCECGGGSTDCEVSCTLPDGAIGTQQCSNCQLVGECTENTNCEPTYKCCEYGCASGYKEISDKTCESGTCCEECASEPTCDNDGVCEPGESTATCPDCGIYCGNYYCEEGEKCTTCPSDCDCSLAGEIYCPKKGIWIPAQICDPYVETCTDNPALTNGECGEDECESSYDCVNSYTICEWNFPCCPDCQQVDGVPCDGHRYTTPVCNPLTHQCEPSDPPVEVGGCIPNNYQECSSGYSCVNSKSACNCNQDETPVGYPQNCDQSHSGTEYCCKCVPKQSTPCQPGYNCVYTEDTCNSMCSGQYDGYSHDCSDSYSGDEYCCKCNNCTPNHPEPCGGEGKLEGMYCPGEGAYIWKCQKTQPGTLSISLETTDDIDIEITDPIGVKEYGNKNCEKSCNQKGEWTIKLIPKEIHSPYNITANWAPVGECSPGYTCLDSETSCSSSCDLLEYEGYTHDCNLTIPGDEYCCKCTNETKCNCDFKIWIENPRLFTIGNKIPVKLFIQNLCNPIDTYNIAIEKENSPILNVELDDNQIKDIIPREIRVTYPRILVLESHYAGDINFTVTSTSCNITKKVTLTLTDSGLPLNLPEFNFVSLLIIISLAGLIFYRRKF